MDLSRTKLVTDIRSLCDEVPGRSRLARFHQPSGSVPRLWPENLAAADYPYEPSCVPATEVFSVPNVELGPDFTPYADGSPFCHEPIFPPYVKEYHDSGFVKTKRVVAVRTATTPAFCVGHFNMRTYGHFLLEVLPKLLLARMLQCSGLSIPVAFPGDIELTGVAEAILHPDGLLLYESKRERLHLPVGVLPSTMTSPAYSGDLHPLFVALLRSFAFEAAHSSVAEKRPGPRLFLSRGTWLGYRTLANEEELWRVARDFGFDRVVPQDLGWVEQVGLFYRASHVMGAYNSALHGTLFSQAGTNVISLGRVNSFQEGISASLDQPIGFLHPADGEILDFAPEDPSPHAYQVSAEALRSRLKNVVFERNRTTGGDA